MARQTKVSDIVSIKNGSSAERQKARSLSAQHGRAVSLYNGAKNALKIIMVSLLFESSDFFSNYDNFKSIFSIFDTFDITIPEKFSSVDEFNRSPTTQWVNMSVLLFSILAGFGEDSGLKSVSAVDEYDGSRNGEIIELVINTEEIDDKAHTMSLVMPKPPMPPYLAVDSTPMLF